jgi:hypothetical protein
MGPVDPSESAVVLETGRPGTEEPPFTNSLRSHALSMIRDRCAILVCEVAVGVGTHHVDIGAGREVRAGCANPPPDKRPSLRIGGCNCPCALRTSTACWADRHKWSKEPPSRRERLGGHMSESYDYPLGYSVLEARRLAERGRCLSRSQRTSSGAPASGPACGYSTSAAVSGTCRSSPRGWLADRVLCLALIAPHRPWKPRHAAQRLSDLATHVSRWPISRHSRRTRSLMRSSDA